MRAALLVVAATLAASAVTVVASLAETGPASWWPYARATVAIVVLVVAAVVLRPRSWSDGV